MLAQADEVRVIAGGFNYLDPGLQGLLAYYAMEEGGGLILYDQLDSAPPASLHNTAFVSAWVR
jgi:hypothetical protein